MADQNGALTYRKWPWDHKFGLGAPHGILSGRGCNGLWYERVCERCDLWSIGSSVRVKNIGQMISQMVNSIVLIVENKLGCIPKLFCFANTRI